MTSVRVNAISPVCQQTMHRADRDKKNHQTNAHRMYRWRYAHPHDPNCQFKQITTVGIASIRNVCFCSVFASNVYIWDFIICVHSLAAKCLRYSQEISYTYIVFLTFRIDWNEEGATEKNWAWNTMSGSKWLGWWCACVCVLLVVLCVSLIPTIAPTIRLNIKRTSKIWPNKGPERERQHKCPPIGTNGIREKWKYIIIIVRLCSRAPYTHTQTHIIHEAMFRVPGHKQQQRRSNSFASGWKEVQREEAAQSGDVEKKNRSRSPD